MKRLLLILLFLLIPFSIPTSVSAQSPTIINPSTIISPSPIPTEATTTNQPSFFARFFSWLFGLLFAKTDYTINSRSIENINSDMTNYGDIKQKDEYEQKHSFAGSRLTDINNQTCLKGNTIKKVILGLNSNDTSLSNICSNSPTDCFVSTENNGCTEIKISNLAHYFVQIQKQFYCNNTNELTNIDISIIEKVQQLFPNPIPENELDCYQQIYDDFYLTPKDSNDEENAKKIIQTPISNERQNSNLNTKDLEEQVNQNFTPDNTVNPAGLSGLRPAEW